MSDLIDRWMNEPTITRSLDDEGNIYGIRIIGRGEHLFFQENDDALICEIDAAHGVIYSRSVKDWNTKGKMKNDEKKRVVGLIEFYYKKYLNENVVLM